MNSPGKDILSALNSPRSSSNITSKQQKLQLQKNQLRVILNDFKKVKTKCQSLSIQLAQQFNKKQQFDKLEKIVPIKVELLDITGIVNLKNQLIKALTQLYDFQHELVYKKQRNQLRYNSPQAPKPKKSPQFPPQIQNFTLQVPNYHTREQQNLLKIDRVTNYLHDLRKNMRRLSTAMFKNYETKDFLMNQPEYLQVKQKLERYKMRNQEINNILQKKIEQQVQKFISSCQTIEQNDEFKILKIYDNDVKQMGKMYESTQTRQWNDGIVGEQFRNFKVKKRSNKPQLMHVKSQKDIRSLRLIKNNSSKQQNQLRNSHSKDLLNDSANKNLNSSRISKRSSKMGSQIRDQSQDKNNYVYMVHKFGPQSQKNSSIISSLSSLRSKRKKVFNDDIWDEFDKI